MIKSRRLLSRARQFDDFLQSGPAVPSNYFEIPAENLVAGPSTVLYLCNHGDI
jgi:hypothetical protein